MKCKTELVGVTCVDASWSTKQSRTLNNYKKIGHDNAFRMHMEYLKGLGCEIQYILFNGGGGRYDVIPPIVEYLSK